MAGNLVFILGDQLSPDMSSLRAADRERDTVLMCEVAEETTYVRHHKQKIVFVLSAMRHFAARLERDGWQVRYVRLDDAANSGSFTGELKRAVRAVEPSRILVTEPGEWRVAEAMAGWAEATSVSVDIREDDRFLCSLRDFRAWAKGRRALVMEHFYREMRRRTGLLMAGDEPEGGRWNFDAENRKPASRDLFLPKRPGVEPDAITREVMALVEARFGDHFGTLEGFRWAVTQADAEAALKHFVEEALPGFGDTQDAMLAGEAFMHHALLSPYINVGLLDALAVCRAAERAYLEGDAPLNAVEGFIRQIVGWREYVRGVYWLKMPDYARMNHLDATRDLPGFYWSAETDMACLREVVTMTRDNAYAHHIQRLMITGNFAMLAGVEPRQIHEWYLEVYADAFEWVELPNVIGMSQFADGGILGTKPYAAGGAYIDRMSDYCGGCSYDPKKKTGAGACPFNALYWDFLARNETALSGNRRLAQVYANWRRMDPATRDAYRESARAFLVTLD